MDRHLLPAGLGEVTPRPRIALDPARLHAARAALSVFGPVHRQEPIEWAAEEPLAPDLAEFYREVGPDWVEIDTLGLPLLMFPLERLWDEQAGYRWNHRTGAMLADWNEDWTVVAKQGAEPFVHEAATGHVLMAHGEEGWEDRLGEPVPVFRDVAEMTLALCAAGAAWAGSDDPFTADWHVRPEVTSAVVDGLEQVLGDRARAVDVARRLGHLRAA
ncbi:hypothetical protein [Micrococcus porci]|uniref:hypothetical protein n=1 Tax=Micrococcus porci TaxID=2856555 RepID=UPI003CEE30FC